MKRLKIGDIFEIPLSDKRLAYGQYVFRDERQGPLIRIFDLIVKKPLTMNDLQKAGELFPPIITGVGAAVRRGIWKLIGNIPVENFRYPLFISGPLTKDEKVITQWFLWDGKKYTRLGPKLPDKYKNLEDLVVWSPYDVVNRIETGKNPLSKWLDTHEERKI